MEDKVWYVAYGSNMLRERFMVYINGGRFCDIKKTYSGCTDKTPPTADEPLTIPFELYFGNESKTWGGGVAFIDKDKSGQTKGRAYLITTGQFDEIQAQEGNGPNWYNCVIELKKDRNGIPYKLFTNENRRPENSPSKEYRAIYDKGLKEVYG